jgi:OOP family OmpA-OmpF porin
MNNMKIITAAVALLGCATNGSALAQSSDYGKAYNPSWYIAPSFILADPDDRFGSFNTAKGAGLRFGKPINPSWDIQIGPTYTRSSNGPNRYQQATLGVDALYMFSRERFRPFLLLGAGAEVDKVSTPLGKARDTSPYVNVGLGFQYSLGEQWGMQADLRRARSFISGNDFAFRNANTTILNVGLTYAFEKRASPPPVARMAPEPAPVAAAPVYVAPPAPAAPAPPAPRFERYTLSSTELFGFDSAVLRMPQPKLDEIASALSGNAQVTNVTITGYTDRLGSEKYNMDLSQRRADSVKTYLASKGIESGRLSAVAKGESNPVVQCSETNRAALIKCLEPNRRVEVEQIVIERRVN